MIAEIEATPPAPLAMRRREHLKLCWKCQARKQHLQDTILKVVAYEQELLTAFLPPPPYAEERLMALLDHEESSQPPSLLNRTVLRLQWLKKLRMKPILIGALAILLGLGVFLASRKPPKTNDVTVHAFLNGVQASDHDRIVGEPGVAIQKISVRTPQSSFEHTVYYDLQRRRHAKEDRIDAGEEQVRLELAAAGVDWQEPLSGASFVSWYMQTANHRDDVTNDGKGLLTLTTTVDAGTVADESLTVRRSDFHPVARSVRLRDSGTIEIAELDYTVVAWSAINESIFESSRQQTSPVLAMPNLPSRQTLDEAELNARLVLCGLDADSAEQLAFSRSSEEVEIRGVVETEERKRQLLAALRSVPYVQVSIFSADDMTSRPTAAQLGRNIREAYTDVSGPSPLSVMYQAHDRAEEDASQASQQLLDVTLTIQQESSTITGLFRRFPAESDLSDRSRAMLAELLTRHFDKLDNALTAEEHLARTFEAITGQAPDGIPAQHASGAESLSAAAVRNRALITELISGSKTSLRTAREIVPEILESIAEVRGLVHTSRGTTPGVAVAGPTAHE
jgi:hypothetical protein